MTNDQRQQRTLHVALQEFIYSFIYCCFQGEVETEILPVLAPARGKERTEAKNTISLV